MIRMIDELMKLSDQEEIEQRNESKRRKRQALSYIEEESNFKEEKDNEFI